MGRRWQLQEAKARLSELVKAAQTEGPQEITLRGDLAVVVLSRDYYERLVRPRSRFVRFIRESPLAGVGLDLRRNRSPVRDVDL